MGKFICCSHIGKRLNYEDNYYLNGQYMSVEVQKKMEDNHLHFICGDRFSDIQIFAVSDGMGGHNAGEVASRMCVSKIALASNDVLKLNSIEEISEYIQNIIFEINNEIVILSHKNSDLQGMGATLVLLIIYKDEYAILNIGDSRAYCVKSDGIAQITKDHTEGQRLIDLGILTRKELRDFPARKNLSRYIGYNQPGYNLSADIYYPKIDEGVLMLCSDGLYDALTDCRIMQIFNLEKNLEDIGKRLVEEAALTNNADNITVILIPIRK